MIDICGVDEAGRGPLAGSVVAAAVIFNPLHPIEGLDDSKKLSEKTRLKLYNEIIQYHQVSVASVPASIIDKINIRQATLLAMQRAVKGFLNRPLKVLVDGRDTIPNIISTAIIGGDGKEQSIAAASIIAKVTRDKMMLHADTLYPFYGFAKHKAYGTKLHIEMIKEHGLSPLHRKSFATK